MVAVEALNFNLFISHLQLNQMRTCCNGLTENFFPSNQLPRNVTHECHQLQRASHSKDDEHKLQTGMALMTTIFCSYHRSTSDTGVANHVFDRC